MYFFKNLKMAENRLVKSPSPPHTHIHGISCPNNSGMIIALKRYR